MPAKPMVDSAVYVNRVTSRGDSIVISLEYMNTGIQEDRKTGDRGQGTGPSVRSEISYFWLSRCLEGFAKLEPILTKLDLALGSGR